MDDPTHCPLIELLRGLQLTGEVSVDAPAFLIHHGHPRTAEHSRHVAAQARRLAEQFGIDAAKAEAAGWLHDISAVVALAERVRVAGQLGLDVLPAEERAPMILHQKLSAAVAQEAFGVADQAVLSAIGCHTTLKADASALDKAVFVADKIAWDQPGDPPYLEALLAALRHSLDAAALCYLDYLWQRREALPAVHPWFAEAYRQLSSG